MERKWTLKRLDADTEEEKRENEEAARNGQLDRYEAIEPVKAEE